MSNYLIPIETAILTFPILAGLITIPYIIIQYRRYGSLSPFRIVIVYSFVFYLCCAYFLVILPLPPMDEVANYTNPIMQLIPFEGYREFTLSTSFVLQQPSTYWAALNEPSLFLIVFNILLTVPFGVFLRYYFKCSWKKTLLCSILLTLSFECIQLSALFGIYPRPYRLFDVDDLFNNTLGGMIGYAITPLLVHFLPTRTKIDETSLRKGQTVRPLRRIFAFFIDMLILMIASLITLSFLLLGDIVSLRSLSISILYIYYIYVFVIVIAISIFTKGKTIGKAVVNIRIVKNQEESLTWYQQILHYFMYYICILPCPYYIFLLLISYFDTNTSNLSSQLFMAALLIVFYMASLMHCVHCLFLKDGMTWFDRRSKIHNISTIAQPLVHTKKEEPQDSSISQSDIPDDTSDLSNG